MDSIERRSGYDRRTANREHPGPDRRSGEPGRRAPELDLAGSWDRLPRGWTPPTPRLQPTASVVEAEPVTPPFEYTYPHPVAEPAPGFVMRVRALAMRVFRPSGERLATPGD